MFNQFLRIPPLVFIQICLLIGAFVAITCLDNFPKCYFYLLIQSAIEIFLIEIILSIKLILDTKKYRKKYICQLACMKKWKFYAILCWNQLNILIVFIMLNMWIINDGITLTSQDMVQNQHTDGNCGFQLYPMCIYSSIYETKKIQEKIIIWFLYSFIVFLNYSLMVLTVLQSYKYYEKVFKYEKFTRESAITLYQSLLDCTVIQNCKSSKQMCSICLGSYYNEKTIILQCQHIFHSSCIMQWLKNKDGCPFRCGQ